MARPDLDPMRATEAWFIRRGLPQFVASYDSVRDLWTRAQPFSIVVMAVELAPFVLVAVLPGGTAGPLLALGVALAAILLFGLWSRLRRGYWFAPPHRVGWVFLAFFVLAPAVTQAAMQDVTIAGSVTLELTGGFDEVLGVLVTQALVLVVVYLFVRFAVVSMFLWAVRQTAHHSRDLYNVATKALPLLLIVLIVLFVNTEMWQVAGSLDAAVLWASVGLLLVLGVLVTFERTRAQIRTLDYDASIDDVRQSCRGTPMQSLAYGVTIADRLPLRRRQRGNLIVAAMATQFIQAALIGVVVWAFFMVFGVIAITEPVQATWLGDLAPNDVVWQIGPSHAVTRALFRVATFVAGFAAFYTTVYAASDDTYKASFATDTGAELQRAINVQRVYTAARLARAAAAQTAPS